MAWQRKIPFGYMIQNGETVTCPMEASTVQSIFTRYLAGASYAKIAEEMSKGNIPYHQHTPRWNKHMVKRILENEKYTGRVLLQKLSALALSRSRTMASWIGISIPVPMRPLFLMRCSWQCNGRNSPEPKILKRQLPCSSHFDRM